MSGGASGGATRDECKIDIHSQAPLQPRGALIRVFIQSFICRARQAGRHVDRGNMCVHTRTQSPRYSAHVKSECDGFILFLSLSPFQSLDKSVLHHLSGCYCSSDVWFACACPLGINASLESEHYQTAKRQRSSFVCS